MTRQTRTSREAENRLDALETPRENELGWFDLMDYSIESGDVENPPSPDEYFGEGWIMPDWVDDLRERQRENDRKREAGEL